MKKISPEEFIERCIKRHNGFYLYNETKYIGALDQIIVGCPIHGSFSQRAERHLKGAGCPKCAHDSKRMTQEEFIQLARQIHNDRFDYSRVVYKAYHSKIEIICKIHGSFQQTPGNHLYGKICRLCAVRECSENLSMSKDEFIRRANEIHHFRNDYSNVIYVNNNTKVSITCHLHGDFLQVPVSHLAGSNCPRCAGRSQDRESFIEKAKSVHNDKYDYSLVNYIDSSTDVRILCPIHGAFKQRPGNHLFGKGCNYCAKDKQKIPLDEFLSRAKNIHGVLYDYSEVTFNVTADKVKIFCKRHQKYFYQKVASHLMGSGCPTCGNAISKLEIEWLQSLNIPEECWQKTLILNGRRFRVDAYVPDTNHIYEFLGDIWHGNLRRFKPEDLNPCNKQSFAELNRRTVEREEVLKSHGFTVISIWESDYLKGKKKCPLTNICAK